MVIYIDIFFIKNLVFNGMLLYLTSLLIRKKTKMSRIVIASIIGALYSIWALYYKSIFDSSMLKICMSIIMLLISFGKKEIKEMLSSFFIASYGIAGIIASLLDINSQILMLLFAISMMLIFYIYKSNYKNRDYYELRLEIMENQIDLIAKLDTGNELSDAIFGDAVIVVSEEKIKNKIETELIKILNNERLEIPDKYKNRIKLISFTTISGEGIKIGIKLDKAIIYTENQKIENKAIMVLTESKLKKYDALIGRNLLEGGFKYENNSFDKIKN